jgi:hypothetical protein
VIFSRVHDSGWAAGASFLRGRQGGKDRPRCAPRATIRWHKPEMNRVANPIQSAFFCLAVLSLPSCSSVHVGDFIPHAIDGLPSDTPPRRGTPEYDAWMAKRAEEAARPKTEQQPK